jgi:hypothetical protein
MSREYKRMTGWLRAWTGPDETQISQITWMVADMRITAVKKGNSL